MSAKIIETIEKGRVPSGHFIRRRGIACWIYLPSNKLYIPRIDDAKM